VRVPDLQVEAGTAAGVELPELAEAVARTLIASGARVFLGGPANKPCARCARVAVTDLGQGRCRIDITQGAHMASTILNLGESSPLFDRARAIAIQVRLLVRGEPVDRLPESSGRPLVRKGAAKPAPERPGVESPAIADSPPVETRSAPELPREPGASVSVASPVAPLPSTRRTEASATTPLPKPALAERSPPPRRQAEEEKRQSERSEPADVVHLRKAKTTSARWPWIPVTIGVGATVAAGLCALAARDRYDALSNKSRSYPQAVSLRQDGKNWQTTAFIASGVAVAGLGLGIWGFVTSGSAAKPLSPTMAMIPGGAMVALTGGLP
jgi:hypothetical protein